jgi:Uma2 family endonuclease
LQPRPGTATERDVNRIHQSTGRLFELVDGILVEKIMAYLESSVAMRIGRLLGNFVEANNLGNVAGADGAMLLMPGLIRIPDVSFVSWDRLPGRVLPGDPIPGLVPDLVVEVLSEGNTRQEMQRKLRDYFLAGVRLVWFVDPAKRTVQVFTAPDQSIIVTQEQTLDGGDVLPGLQLSVLEIFATLPPSTTSQSTKKTRRKSPPKN